MLLKLVNAYAGDLAWMIRAASIVKWHKAEGETVHYGDDLFDIKVEEVARHQAAIEQANQIHMDIPADYENWAVKQLAAKDMVIEAIDPAGPTFRQKAVFFVRITSSDTGILRRVYAKEGEQREAGDLLALLTTEESEPVDETGHALKDARVFRVVANLFASVEAKIETNGQNRKFVDRNSIIFWSERQGEKRIGIYTKGGSGLHPIFACAPLIHRNLQGTCCILREDQVNFRSDLLLQTLRHLPQEWIDPLITRLGLQPGYFQSRFFDKTFAAFGPHGTEEFPKTVVVLSIVPDVQSFCFRHKEHGFLIPAEPTDELGSIEDLTWFRENFVSVGRIRVEDFMENFGQVIQILRKDAGAHVLVLNTLTAAPNCPTHNCQFQDDFPAKRRLEFNVALVELSQKQDFSIVDVDRIVKRAGTETQLPWGVLDSKSCLLVAKEAYHIMSEWGIV